MESDIGTQKERGCSERVEEDDTMSTIYLMRLVSMDRAMQAPEAPGEDTSEPSPHHYSREPRECSSSDRTTVRTPGLRLQIFKKRSATLSGTRPFENRESRFAVLDRPPHK